MPGGRRRGSGIQSKPSLSFPYILTGHGTAQPYAVRRIDPHPEFFCSIDDSLMYCGVIGEHPTLWVFTFATGVVIQQVDSCIEDTISRCQSSINPRTTAYSLSKFPPPPHPFLQDLRLHFHAPKGPSSCTSPGRARSLSTFSPFARALTFTCFLPFS